MTTLAIISGLSAMWIAGGLSAAALPVAAHLLSRRGGPTIDFPAVRFVRIAAAEQAARDRPRDILLLLMRIAIIALIALAFDRPVWSSNTNANTPTGAAEDVVLIVDASASMTRVAPGTGRTLFEIARDRAIEELNTSSSSGTRAAVVIADLNPEALLPRLTDQTDALTSRLSAQTCTLERADLAAALALAATIPAPQDDAPPRPRRVIVFSDMQAKHWRGVTPPREITLELRAVGRSAPARNLAVSDLELSPPRPIAGREAIVTARITNYSDAPARPTVICAAPDGERSVSPNLAPGASTSLSFPVVFNQVGQAPVRVGLIDASFTHDDAAHIVADVRAARRVALITRAPTTDRQGGAYFLEAALAPTDSGEHRVTRVTPDEATPDLLARFDACVIAQGGQIPAATLDAIRTYIISGGGVLWNIDSQAAHESAAKFNASASSPLLPAAPESRFTQLAGDERVRLRTGEFDTGPLKALQGPAARALLDASFNAHSPASVSTSGVPLIMFDSGAPFIAWAAVGSGRAVTIHADLAPARTNLVKGPMFPVLIHELMRFILPASGGPRAAEVGEPLAARLDATTPINEPVTDAQRRPVRVTRGGSNFDPILTAPPADTPGLASFTDSTAKIIALAAATLSPHESDLRPLTEDEIASILSAEAADIQLTDAAPSADRVHRATELWPWLLAAAVLMLAFESLVAGTTRRRPALEDA